ncbi:hypothetical protein I3843_14G062800 [Carya illinoinensis]|nr:hypothetical protein I3760_14G063800 [Carya illinoinensis]KAG7946826.1 hypothetical protein I3843_14G062800 [Carya illinoinensis]
MFWYFVTVSEDRLLYFFLSLFTFPLFSILFLFVSLFSLISLSPLPILLNLSLSTFLNLCIILFMDLMICDFCLYKKENITPIGLKIVVISTPCLFTFQLLTHCDK